MNKCQELAFTSCELGLAHQILGEHDSAEYIKNVLETFKPARLTGHLAIHNGTLSIPFGKYKTTYPLFMNDEPTYVFFEQSRDDKNCVFILEEGRKLSQVLENTYVFEYF